MGNEEVNIVKQFSQTPLQYNQVKSVNILMRKAPQPESFLWVNTVFTTYYVCQVIAIFIFFLLHLFAKHLAV